MARHRTRREFLRDVGTTAAVVAGLTRAWDGTAHAAVAPGKLRFGIQARPEHVTYADMRRVWREADELGLDSAFTFDHFMPIDGRPEGACFEGWTMLSALAAQTERIRVGVLVTGNTYRFPAVLAKMAATVDHVSNGRLILGIGAGWFEREHAAYGIPFHTPGGRARRMVEAVEVVKMLFTQERSTFEGKYYRLADAPFQPRAVQRPHPPILIGGMGPKVVQPCAAKHAQIWHFFVRDGVDEVRRTVVAFDALVRQAGREPAEVEKSVSLRPPDIAGKPAKEVRAHVQALADAGVGHFILSLPAPYDWEVLRRYAKEVAPAFRG